MRHDKDALYCAAVVPKKNTGSFPIYWLLISGLPPQEDKSKLLAFEKKLKESLNEILVDAILEDTLIDAIGSVDNWRKLFLKEGFKSMAVKQFMPGVTDNPAHIVEEAIQLHSIAEKIKVASGRIYLNSDGPISFGNSEYKLFHPVVERLAVFDLNTEISTDSFPHFPEVSLTQPDPPQPININISDDELSALSKERLLALTVEEMKAIQKHFADPKVESERKKVGLPSSPTDLELEVIAQTWSEHCKHKIFNATIEFTDKSSPEPKKSKIESLYKSFIQKATSDLSHKRKDLLSVFVDNSGVVDWDDTNAICFKVETHNSPSALEPYGGSLTGILGVNRDVIGTGLGAKPIFNTDILCFAYPSDKLTQRPKLLPAQTILDGVRKGIQDGGNKSGIPTVNGAVFFDDRYRAKPLVFCGTGGILPKKVGDRLGYKKYAQPGDIIVMAGGRVGKDGVHGATFSSEALHEGSPVTAVQIGDPFTQKRLLDFVLEARDQNLITALTDNGAGGLSSSVGEMAELTGGAKIDLESVPTKYQGLADWEIVVSESQERMTIATNQFEKLKKIADKHHVEVSAIGVFNESGKFEVARQGKLIGALELEFLHKGVPTLKLEAEYSPPQIKQDPKQPQVDYGQILLKLLAHPNIANKETIVRQYDHEVQAMSVIKPLMGRRQNAPCDAAVLTPVLGDKRGLAVSNGLAPRLSETDAYLMALSAVDEAVRNLVCVGADPKTISLLDNFCWPDPVDSPKNKLGKAYLGMLVKTCQGLYDAVIAYESPLISGKDSMKNDFDDGVVRLSVPPTLLVSAIAHVPNIEEAVTMDFKGKDDGIYLLKAGKVGLNTSHFEDVSGHKGNSLPSLNLALAKDLYQKLHKSMREKLVRSAHDLSEGGLAVALAESVIGSEFGATVNLDSLEDAVPALFGEGPGHIVITVQKQNENKIEQLFGKDNLIKIGEVTEEPSLNISKNKTTLFNLDRKALEQAWNTQLPFD
jgi:phosphoribosylformylglycinamidine synthase